MTVYDRLKMELSNQQYLSEEQYKQFLVEEDLTPTADYDKAKMQKQLLFTVIDILEAVSNDIDTMRTISTEFADIGAAYSYIQNSITAIKNKIATIPDDNEAESPFSLMYTRGGTRTMGSYIDGIPSRTIDGLN